MRQQEKNGTVFCYNNLFNMIIMKNIAEEYHQNKNTYNIT